MVAARDELNILTFERMQNIAKNVADRFSRINWSAPFTQKKPISDPIIQKNVEEKPLEGALAALHSPTVNHEYIKNNVVSKYRKHENEYPDKGKYLGSDEELAFDIQDALVKHFVRNPEENKKPGAYMSAAVNLPQDDGFHKEVCAQHDIRTLLSLDTEGNNKTFANSIPKDLFPIRLMSTASDALLSKRDAFIPAWNKLSEKANNINQSLTWGKLVEAGAGIGVGIALKATFNSVAVASGVGLVAAIGYGVAKTTYDEYAISDKTNGRISALGSAFAKASGWDALKEGYKEYKTELDTNHATHGEAIKSVLSKMTGYGTAKQAFTAKSDEGKGIISSTFGFIKNLKVHSTLKNSAVFGIGIAAGFGIGADVDVTEKAPVVAVTPAVVDTLEEVEETNQLTDEEMEIPSVFDEETPLSDEVIKEALWLSIMDDIGFDASSQDIKDRAVIELWSEGGNQELGAKLMQEAAKMGNFQALRDVAELTNMGIISDVSITDRLADMSIPEEIQERLDSDNPKVAAQALNDVAIGALGSLHGDHGIEKNFLFGVNALEELVISDHGKSLKDMETLLDHSMITIDMLSPDAQMKLLDHGMIETSDLTKEAHSILAEKIGEQMQEHLANGSDAVCSRTLDSCQFVESATEEKRSFIMSAFDAVKSQAKTTVDLVTFNQGAKPIFVASIK